MTSNALFFILASYTILSEINTSVIKKYKTKIEDATICSFEY